MKDLIIEKHQKLENKKDIDIRVMAEALEIITKALYPKLVVVENEQNMGNECMILYLKNNNTLKSLDNVEGFVEIKKEKLELQYHDTNDAGMTIIMLEKKANDASIGAFIVHDRLTLTVFNDRIVVNDKVIPFDQQSGIIDKAKMVAEIIQQTYHKDGESIHSVVL